MNSAAIDSRPGGFDVSIRISSRVSSRTSSRSRSSIAGGFGGAPPRVYAAATALDQLGRELARRRHGRGGERERVLGGG